VQNCGRTKLSGSSDEAKAVHTGGGRPLTEIRTLAMWLGVGPWLLSLVVLFFSMILSSHQ